MSFYQTVLRAPHSDEYSNRMCSFALLLHQSARDTLASSFLTIKHSVPSHSLHALQNQEAVGFSIHLSKSSSFQHYLGCVHFYLPSLSADKVLPIHGNPASGLILRLVRPGDRRDQVMSTQMWMVKTHCKHTILKRGYTKGPCLTHITTF